MATETMNRVIAGGPPEGSRLTTGSGETVALISAGSGSCSPNGQHGSASAGSLSEIASQMDGPSRQRLLLRPSAEEKERWSELSKPLCVDLYSGLGGWSEAFLAEGYRCIGFDVEAHDYGTGGYPGELILRDVRSIHGSELKDAVCIVASPPCTEYSYMAMPWKRAKQIEKALTGRADFPEGYMGSRTIEQLNELFNTCFRIQREAIEAAGHHIPLIVENVRGAQKWVGRARWNYGSFYLWGDVPALMPMTLQRGFKGSVMNFHEYEKTGKPGRSFQSAAVAEMGIKGVPHRTKGHWTNPAEHEGVKNGNDWFGSGENYSLQRRVGSKSNARKAASAMIAKIPYPLAQWIARAYYPSEKEASA